MKLKLYMIDWRTEGDGRTRTSYAAGESMEDALEEVRRENAAQNLTTVFMQAVCLERIGGYRVELVPIASAKTEAAGA